MSLYGPPLLTLLSLSNVLTQNFQIKVSCRSGDRRSRSLTPSLPLKDYSRRTSILVEVSMEEGVSVVPYSLTIVDSRALSPPL